MKYYPVYLNIEGKDCLVVGGGDVGTRKAKTLLDCGARVTVVSPEATPDLVEMAASKTIRLENRPYRIDDLENVFLVIGATDDAELNFELSRDAQRRNLLCNIADRPEACNFILPSIVRRGDLIVAVSTSGTSPAFAKNLRKDLERRFGEEYAIFLRILGDVRSRLLRETHAPEAHKGLFESLIQSDLLEQVKKRDVAGINALLKKTCGEGYEIDALP